MAAAAEVAPETIPAACIGGRQRLAVFPAERAEAPVAVCLPALGIAAAYYTLLGECLARRGVHAVLADLPGRGQSPVVASRDIGWSYGDVVRQHLPALRAAAVARFPRSGFYWLGHSLGGHLALMSAGLAPEGVRGVVLVASGTPHFRAWRGAGAIKVLAGTQVAGALGRIFGYLPGDRLGLLGREAGSLIRDWSQVARSGRFTFPDFDGEAALAACVSPVVALNLEGDALAPPEATTQLLRKIASRDIQRSTWSASSPRVDHNRWPREPEVPAARAAAWVAEHDASGASG